MAWLRTSPVAVMQVEMKTEAVAVLLVKMGKVKVASPNCPIVPSPDTLTNGAATDKKARKRQLRIP
jgi:hypothetical protein